ncbi:MAG: delta-60 repeat domain-containing protein [Verrucomicrobiia bacterium]
MHQSCSFFNSANWMPGVRSLRPAFSLAAMIVARAVVAGEPGSSDPGFVNSLTGVEWISDLAFQPDGKIVLAGSYIGWGQPQACVARVQGDGKFDSTFKVGLGNAGSWAGSVLMQPDGRILVGGYFTNFNDVPCRSIVRLNADGNIDPTFETAGAINGSGMELMSLARRILNWFLRI